MREAALFGNLRVIVSRCKGGSTAQRDFDRGQSDSARAAGGFVYRRTAHNLPQPEVDEINRLFRDCYEALR